MDRTLFRVTGLVLVIVGTYALACFVPPTDADPGGVNLVRELFAGLILAGITQLAIARKIDGANGGTTTVSGEGECNGARNHNCDRRLRCGRPDRRRHRAADRHPFNPS